ncbi:hypothetical protein GQ457_06G020960 [Hibiscus cannabinus]
MSDADFGGRDETDEICDRMNTVDGCRPWCQTPWSTTNIRMIFILGDLGGFNEKDDNVYTRRTTFEHMYVQSGMDRGGLEGAPHNLLGVLMKREEWEMTDEIALLLLLKEKLAVKNDPIAQLLLLLLLHRYLY